MNMIGRTILVSGSSSGLGAACAQRFLAQGAKVIGLDRTSEPGWLKDYRGADRQAGEYWHGQADVVDEASVRQVVLEGAERFGELSGAVCCAGILHGQRVLGPNAMASLDAFRRVIDVNLVGTFNVVCQAADAMSRATPSQPDQERGVIVMTSSIAAMEGQIGQCAYAASKGGVAAMTLPMARELARFGIRVVSIAPGVFDTAMMQGTSSKVRDPLLSACVFPKRFGLAQEFAAMVQYVFENSMLNGSILRLDGSLRM